MRHQKKGNHLSRTASHRKAMFANMACSLITHKRINTTVAKAKALRGYVEPLLTKSKTDTTHSRRVVFGYLRDKDVVNELFREVSPKIAERPGGYTRIIKTGYRVGDNAEMCMMELVDYNELYQKEEKTKKTRRSRRGGKKKKSSEAKTPARPEGGEAKTAEQPKAEAKEEKPKAEAKTEEPKAEAKEPARPEGGETPKAEAKEEPKAEAAEAEAPAKEEKKEPARPAGGEKKEAKAEAPAEEKGEEKKPARPVGGDEQKEEDSDTDKKDKSE